jgi:hypothetical protein
MSRYLGAALAASLLALTVPAQADTVLTFGTLPSSAVVPQSASNPAIIAATQAQNPVGFGFNNFVSNGQTGSGTFFSTNQVGGSLGDNVEVGAIPYTVGQLAAFILNGVSFGVAIDVNSAEGGNPPTIMQLVGFDLFRVDAALTHIDRLAHIDQTYAMPDIRPGNGKGDYLLTGFDLSGLNAGDRLIFRAQFTGATDGGDSFYIVANPNVQAVPLPAGVWLFGSGIAGLGLLKLRRRKQQQQLAA